MRAKQDSGSDVRRPGRRRGLLRQADVVWRARDAGFARAVLRWLGRACAIALAVVFVVTAFLVWVFGHPLALSIVGCLFAALPLAGLAVTGAVWLRAAVVAGPRWVGVRLVRRWRVVDLDQVRAVRLAGGGGTGPGGFGGFGGFSGFGGFGGFGGSGGSGGPGLGRGFWVVGSAGGSGSSRQGGPGLGFPGSRIVLEDESGAHVDLALDALGSGVADVLAYGLGPDARVEPDAAAVLQESRLRPAQRSDPGSARLGSAGGEAGTSTDGSTADRTADRTADSEGAAGAAGAAGGAGGEAGAQRSDAPESDVP